jgi:hypothetical protein
MTRAGLIHILLAVFLFAGCDQQKLPAGVLTKEEYAALLVEVHLAEARLAGHPVPRDTASGLFFSFEEKLLQKRGLSDSVVKATYQYYLNHPVELEEIYVAVVDTLSLREQRYKGK